ncbi:DUF1403 family protein [Bosea sp. NBC_00550]|uniref:DUF1403 family protein n=1 Tax=Bosea sp. NBC_00550 TaxID=2969621 RepID=UPI00222E2303|nr:DUF1403 family protein [Bosea sp. NBC_00550]UZF95510.1 DUF1403 family protein [Bosea sp. NBC_00550]
MLGVMSSPAFSATPSAAGASVPAWAVPRGAIADPAEAAFIAGAALNSLDQLVRAAPPWAGAWRQRLALQCAAAAASLVGRTEGEGALRDAWLLRADGDPGPAGNLLAAWRRLAERDPQINTDALRSAVRLLGLAWSNDLAALPERLDNLTRSMRPAPLLAAAAAAEVQRIRPDAHLLGWWLADQVLARRMHWAVAVPLFVKHARGPAFRSAGDRSRIRPGEDGFERAVCVALALAAAEACRLADEIAPRAARLTAVAPKLRAKGAGEVIQLLFDEDAVAGTLQTKSLTRWGSRRLFERLTNLDAVRELSGRATFRLYGL